MSLDLATASYRTFHPSMGVPVQTSLGQPKWPLGYDLTEEARVLMPWGLFDKDLSDDEFTAKYRARLDKACVDRITASLALVASRHRDERLVLLCYEQVLGPQAKFCHRRVWADWWTEQTGQEVPELALATSGDTGQTFIAWEPGNTDRKEPQP